MTMMDLPELIILDVGHGNCAVLRDTDGVVVIDCPHGITLIDTLEHRSIKEISHVLISHADADHIAGIINLLSDENIRIHNIHLNPDPLKKSEIWQDLRIALKDARKRFGTVVSSELTTTKTGKLNIGQVEVQVLAPTPELILGGAGGRDLQGRRLTSNSLSVVIGIVHDSHRLAILAADIDQLGFENLLEEELDLSADILVFPHHGGKPGGADSKTFAQQLCSLVKPNLVIFSIGRGRFGNPREEIVEGVASSAPDAHILCTQLSKQCAASLPGSELTHLNSLPARGRLSKSCCGGTVSIKIDGSRTNYAARITLHNEFIDEQVPTPICRKFLSRAKLV
jgi:competence protein ComEC